MEVTVDLGRSSLSNAETKLISYFVGDLISSWDVDFICLQILWLWICYGSIAANMNLLIAAALLRAFYGYEKKLLEANSVLHSYVGTLVEEATRNPTSHKFLWMNGWYTGQRSSVKMCTKSHVECVLAHRQTDIFCVTTLRERGPAEIIWYSWARIRSLLTMTSSWPP